MTNLRLAASGHFKHSDLQWLFICHAALCWRAQWQCSSVVLGFIVNLHINSILRAIDASWDMVSIVIHERFPEHTVSIPIPQLSDSHWLSYRPCNIAGSKQLIPHKMITVSVSGRKLRVRACWNGFWMDVQAGVWWCACYKIHSKWIAIIWLLNWRFPHLRDN